MGRNPLDDVARGLRMLGERLSQTTGAGDPAEWISDQLRRPEPARTLPELQAELDALTGLETVKDLGSKIVLDAFTCVECGRCQDNCPAWGSGKELNPKTVVLQTQDALDRRHPSDPADDEAVGREVVPADS